MVLSSNASPPPLPQLVKATITNTQSGEHIPVMYNPDEFTLDQGNAFAEIAIPGLNAPPTQYVRGKLRTLAMTLLFDTYERGEDVRAYSGRIVRLLNTLPSTFAPPVLLFAMGTFTFQCVLVDAKQRFTMFLRDGTPVRASLAVTFQEYTRIDVQIAQGFFAGPPTVHTITSSETLQGLAADFLGDARDWRAIAEASGIDDPMHIPPGQRVTIPRKEGQP
ncbi:MAG: LysM peptidoglycan-binding domain-containing protein [Thermomicrobiales bacterium]